MDNLTSKKCLPCEVGGVPLAAEEVAKLREEVPRWEVRDNRRLVRRFTFKNFADALAFVNKIGTLAESEGHHPDIAFGWGYVEITLTTHAVNGLSENDFILTAKIDAIN